MLCAHTILLLGWDSLQLFFAVQADACFLALVAYQHSAPSPVSSPSGSIGSSSTVGVAAAMQHVRQNFLNTWLNDCSVWPLVSFGEPLSLPTCLFFPLLPRLILFLYELTNITCSCPSFIIHLLCSRLQLRARAAAALVHVTGAGLLAALPLCRGRRLPAAPAAGDRALSVALPRHGHG